MTGQEMDPRKIIANFLGLDDIPTSWLADLGWDQQETAEKTRILQRLLTQSAFRRSEHAQWTADRMRLAVKEILDPYFEELNER